jgi:ribosomal protein L2
MSIRLYKSYTPGTRNRALSTFSEITKTKPEKRIERIIVTKAEIIAELLRSEVVVIKDAIE